MAQLGLAFYSHLVDSLVQLGHRCSWVGCYRVQLESGHLLSLLCGVQLAPLLVVHHLVVQLGPGPGLYILVHAGRDFLEKVKPY